MIITTTERRVQKLKQKNTSLLIIITMELCDTVIEVTEFFKETESTLRHLKHILLHITVQLSSG
jgi:proline racemase